MNSVLTRTNSVFFYGVSVLAGLCVINWLTSYWYAYDIQVSKLGNIKVQRLVQLRHPVFRRRSDLAELVFDADVNVSGVFNWNTKQVFVYVQADVETVNGRRFRQVVWDKVVNRTDPQQLQLRAEPVEYPILMPEEGDTLVGASVALSVAWDVMPVSGAMRSGKRAAAGQVSGIVLPSKLCSKAKKCTRSAKELPLARAVALAASGSHRGSWMKGASKPPPSAPAAAENEEL